MSLTIHGNKFFHNNNNSNIVPLIKNIMPYDPESPLVLIFFNQEPITHRQTQPWRYPGTAQSLSGQGKEKALAASVQELRGHILWRSLHRKPWANLTASPGVF